MGEGADRARRAWRSAWVLAAAAAAAAVWAVVAGLRDGGTTEDTWLFVVAAGSVTTAAVGALIAGKTGNATGWLLAVGGVGLGVGLLLGQSASGCGGAATQHALLAKQAGHARVAGRRLRRRGRHLGSLPRHRRDVLPVRPARRCLIARAAGRRSFVAPALAWMGTAVATFGAFVSPRRIEPFGAGLEPGVPDVVLGDARLPGPHRRRGAPGPRGGRRRWWSHGGGNARCPDPTGRSCSPWWRPPPRPALALAATLLIADPGPLWGSSWPFVVAWALAAIAIPLAVAVAVVRSHAFGIYRFVGFMADYRIWTASLGVGAIAAVLALTWLIAWILGVDDVPLAVAAVALAMGAAVYPSWRGWQARVDARYGQHQEDPAEALERLTAEVGDPAQVRGPVFDLLARVAPDGGGRR